MIQATNISKRFGRNTAVDSINLQVDQGTIFGLLGPNASGKTTVIRMLCGILKCDEGEISINNMAINDAKTDFAYVAQYFGQYEELTVWENLTFYARMYNVTDTVHLSSLLDRYHLTPYRNQFAGKLSGGYQRRLAMACALAHDPKVLFLDEPTAGIDPVTRKLLWDDFYRLSTEGKTLLVTTHYMEEAQRCHYLAFLSAGRIVAEGTPETIKQALGKARVYTAEISYLPKLHEVLQKLEGIILLNQFGNELRIVVTPDVKQATLKAIIDSTTDHPCTLNVDEPNLEDVFIALTQEQDAKP